MVSKETSSAQGVLGSMFIGTAISFMLHGVTCCQTVWYFRSSSRSSKVMTALILSLWLGETLNCVFVFFATWDSFVAQIHKSKCGDWTGPAQSVTSAICTFSVEGFFIVRMWRLSEQKRLTALAFFPYIVGQGFGFAQTVRSFIILCNPSAPILIPLFVFGTFVSRLFGDGVVAVTMCYMLYTRSSGFTTRTNTVKIVRELILWSISTGILTWLNTLLFLISYLDFLPSGYAIFFMRSGLYVNAMFAQLNARTRYQALANASIPLSTLNLGSTSSRSAEPERVDRELQSLGPIAE